jgi:hypothetical protein
MNRYEQRKQKRLMNPEIAEGYREMAAEFQLMQAIEEMHGARNIRREESGRIIIEPIRMPDFDLESLIAGIKPENLYEEIDFGTLVGQLAIEYPLATSA